MSSQAEWKIIGHSAQIADTGDYDGHYELTNGTISLVTKDDMEDEDIAALPALLNHMGCKWEDWNHSNTEYELHLEKQSCKMWKELAEKLYSTAMPMLEYIGAGEGFSETRNFEETMKEYEASFKNWP